MVDKKTIEWWEPIVVVNPENFSYGQTCRIDSFVKLECGTIMSLGDCVHVASFCHLGVGGGSLLVGSHVSFASGAKVLSGTNTKYGLSLSTCSPDSMQEKSRLVTRIGYYVLIGAQAVVMPGITIGDGAVVGAGAVVTKNVYPCSIVAGNPAKHIGYRTEIAKNLYLDVV